MKSEIKFVRETHCLQWRKTDNKVLMSFGVVYLVVVY